MTTLRRWCDLTPAQKDAAIRKAQGLFAAGQTRWHAVARLCGLKDGVGLRCAMDDDWRRARMSADKARYKARRSSYNGHKTEQQQQTSRERGQVRATMASAIAHYVPAPITLPRVRFLEGGA